MEHLGNAEGEERRIQVCLFDTIIVFGFRGCAEEVEELCHGLDHHPGDAVYQYSGGEDKERKMSSNINIYLYLCFSGSVRWNQGRSLMWVYSLLIRLKVDHEKDIMNVSVEMEEILDFYS